MPRYILSPEAREDLRKIREYLVSQGGRRLARFVLQEIHAAFRLLASRPEAGHLRQDLTPPAARPLDIVRVLNGRRDVEAILEQRTV